VLDALAEERADMLAQATLGLPAETLAAVADALAHIKSNVVAGLRGRERPPAAREVA
jgi:hypothetical protein